MNTLLIKLKESLKFDSQFMNKFNKKSKLVKILVNPDDPSIYILQFSDKLSNNFFYLADLILINKVEEDDIYINSCGLSFRYVLPPNIDDSVYVYDIIKTIYEIYGDIDIYDGYLNKKYPINSVNDVEGTASLIELSNANSLIEFEKNIRKKLDKGVKEISNTSNEFYTYLTNKLHSQIAKNNLESVEKIIDIFFKKMSKDIDNELRILYIYRFFFFGKSIYGLHSVSAGFLLKRIITELRKYDISNDLIQILIVNILHTVVYSYEFKNIKDLYNVIVEELRTEKDFILSPLTTFHYELFNTKDTVYSLRNFYQKIGSNIVIKYRQYGRMAGSESIVDVYERIVVNEYYIKLNLINKLKLIKFKLFSDYNLFSIIAGITTFISIILYVIYYYLSIIQNLPVYRSLDINGDLIGGVIFIAAIYSFFVGSLGTSLILWPSLYLNGLIRKLYLFFIALTFIFSIYLGSYITNYMVYHKNMIMGMNSTHLYVGANKYEINGIENIEVSYLKKNSVTYPIVVAKINLKDGQIIEMEDHSYNDSNRFSNLLYLLNDIDKSDIDIKISSDIKTRMKILKIN